MDNNNCSVAEILFYKIVISKNNSKRSNNTVNGRGKFVILRKVILENISFCKWSISNDSYWDLTKKYSLQWQGLP